MHLSDLDLEGRRALVRVDFNVPQDPDGHITDDTRIRAALPTIRALLDGGASVVLMSHLGRPKGITPALTLRPVAEHLARLLGIPVAFAPDCVDDKALDVTQSLQPGEIALLENLRFHPEEEAGDEFFAGQLAENGDLYINDAFGTAHRAHASTAVIARFFPEDKAFGLLMAAEIEALDRVLARPERPLTALIGGAKVSSKLAIIEHLIGTVDRLIIGGGMAYTFIQAQGGTTGTSLVEPELVPKAREILARAATAGTQLMLPHDTLAADAFAADATTQLVATAAIPDGWMGLDIGPETQRAFAEAILSSRTVLWNGPMGVFEWERFAGGTRAVAEALAEATAAGTFTLVGGGDSLAALAATGLSDRVSYISTGGGAMLEYLEGQVLPGIAAIQD
ncbi:MAG: phosphoglycerate kinase [Flavobacteriales bacterium]